MSSIVIRCDSGLKIGTGHVYRCRNLARELKCRGLNVIFISKNIKGNIIEKIQEEFMVYTINKDEINENSDQVDNQWIKCKETKDAKQTIKVLPKKLIGDIKWMVVDNYEISHIWERIVKKELLKSAKKIKVMVIDDMADKRHEADVIINADLFNKTQRSPYEKLIPTDCVQLLGPKYSLIGKEYKREIRKVKRSGKLERIMIYFGGNDRKGLGYKIIKILRKSKLRHLKIDIIIGETAKYQQRIRKMENKNKNIKVYNSVPSMAPYIAKADFSFGAGGGTSWERTCLGLATMTFVVAKNQELFSKALATKMGKEWMAVKKTPRKKEVIKLLNTISMDKKELYEISKELMKLCDGNGCSRVADIITRTKLEQTGENE